VLQKGFQMSDFPMPISQQIWDMKYRLKDQNGAFLEHTVEDTWRRIAVALSKAEANPKKWESIFYDSLTDFKFLPAGRIIAGSGTARNVTLFNCFVMGVIPDSMSGIFDMLKEAALTMQQGGGIGYDFSTIRPKGSRKRYCSRCLWASVIYGCLGLYVQDYYVCGLTARRHDGDHEVLPSRY
jgi:ribonucleoside-diphosphate reductase alpha chain